MSSCSETRGRSSGLGHRRRRPAPRRQPIIMRLHVGLISLLVLIICSSSSPRSLRLAHAVRESSFTCPNPDAADGSCSSDAASSSSSSSSISSNTNPSAAAGANNNRRQPLPPPLLPVDDESTLLDLFGEAAKELLTKHVVPPTDAQCRWDWRHARCEPHCDCTLVPLWGDYHLGRSCRLRYEYFDGRDDCHVPPDTPYVKVFGGAARAVRAATVKTLRVARNVSRRADVKRRVLKMRERACSSWEDRADVTGGDMKRWQKRLCGLGGDGHHQYLDEDEYGYEDGYGYGENEEGQDAEELAARMASVHEEVRERESVQQHRRHQHKKQQQKQQQRQSNKQQQQRRPQEEAHVEKEGPKEDQSEAATEEEAVAPPTRATADAAHEDESSQGDEAAIPAQS